MVLTFPSSIKFGYVTGQFLLAVADSPSDPDLTPDPIPAVGYVLFTPRSVEIETSNPPVTILPRPIKAYLDPLTGSLIDANGLVGIWLVQGIYDVTFSFTGVTLDGFAIGVDDNATALNPLDLTLAAPLVSAPGFIFVVTEQIMLDTQAARDEAVQASADAQTAAANAQTNATSAGNSLNTANLAAAAAGVSASTASTQASAAAASATAASGSASAAATSASAVSSALANMNTSLTAYALLASPVFTGNPTAPTPAAADNSTSIATTAFVKAQASAGTASPAFTGIPTAPTAAPGTNTTQIATTAFIAAAIAALIGTAPATLDTLQELAAQLQADEGSAATLTTLVGTKAPLASPALTGVPTAPTAAAGTNTTQIATTAFVAAAVPTDLLAGGRFAPTGKDISNADLNSYLLTGFYHGANLTNAPAAASASDSWHIEVKAAGADTTWTTQVADRYGNLAGSTPTRYSRTNVNGVWGAWRQTIDSTILGDPTVDLAAAFLAALV